MTDFELPGVVGEGDEEEAVEVECQEEAFGTAVHQKIELDWSEGEDNLVEPGSHVERADYPGEAMQGVLAL